MKERYALAAVARFAEENACTDQYSSPQQTEILGNDIAEQIAIEYDSNFCSTDIVSKRFYDVCNVLPLIFKQHYEWYFASNLDGNICFLSADHRKHTAVLCPSAGMILSDSPTARLGGKPQRSFPRRPCSKR